MESSFETPKMQTCLEISPIIYWKRSEDQLKRTIVFFRKKSYLMKKVQYDSKKNATVSGKKVQSSFG